MKLLAEVLSPKEQICFGPFCDQLKKGDDPNATALNIIGSVMGKTVNLIIIFSAFIALIMLFIGAINWITSGGDKERMQKAQQRIMYAVIGLLIVAITWSVWTLLTGGILGIFERGADGGIMIKIPSFLD